MIPNQTTPHVVCNFAEPQRSPVMTHNNLLNEIVALNHGHRAIQIELKGLVELCSNISKTVSELSEKLSQYDIDSGSEVSANNENIDEDTELTVDEI